ncbi:MAG: glycosyltransferase [Oscillospiraceae bacterium]|nr:glycosyltransferase [Oscillospiraceae bacterium]
MILVTLGTQFEPFTRLLDMVENSSLTDEIIVQAGHTKYKSKKMKLFDFISFDEMDALIDKADFIITHGGTGSILTPLKKGKKVIACARLSKYKEHVDNHQTEIVSILSQQGYILELKENAALDNLLSLLDNFSPKVFISNADSFKYRLRECIG